MSTTALGGASPDGRRGLGCGASVTSQYCTVRQRGPPCRVTASLVCLRHTSRSPACLSPCGLDERPAGRRSCSCRAPGRSGAACDVVVRHAGCHGNSRHETGAANQEHRIPAIRLGIPLKAEDGSPFVGRLTKDTWEAGSEVPAAAPARTTGLEAPLSRWIRVVPWRPRPFPAPLS